MLHPDIRVSSDHTIFPYRTVFGIDRHLSIHQQISLGHLTANCHLGNAASHDHIGDDTVILCHKIPANDSIRTLRIFRNRSIIFL